MFMNIVVRGEKTISLPVNQGNSDIFHLTRIEVSNAILS